MASAGLTYFQAGSAGIIAWQGGQAYQSLSIQAQYTNVGAALGNPTESVAWLDTAVGLPSPTVGVPNTGQYLWDVPYTIESGWYSFRVQSHGTSQKFNISQPMLVQGQVKHVLTLLASVADVTAFAASSITSGSWPPSALELNLGLTGQISPVLAHTMVLIHWQSQCSGCCAVASDMQNPLPAFVKAKRNDTNGCSLLLYCAHLKQHLLHFTLVNMH